MEKFELKIGDRVDVNGEIATIKFLGSVPPFEGKYFITILLIVYI